MKTLKILLLCIIPLLGVYAINKIHFGQKLIVMFPGHAPGPRPGGPQGPPPPEMGQDGPQTPVAEGVPGIRPGQVMESEGPQAPVAEGEHERQPGPVLDSEGPQAPPVEGERLSQGPPPRPAGEEVSRWKVRINFNMGIKNMGYLTLILAFLIELTYLADRLIRRKPLL